MRCPGCDGALVERTEAGVVVDLCEQGCAGVWFDALELAKVDENHEAAGRALLEPRTRRSASNGREQRRCPKCADMPLGRHYFSVKRKVEVDECPQCGGIWLDAGELAAIRQEFVTAQARKKAADEEFGAAVRKAFAPNEEQTRAEADRARKISHALRFICPSYWIPGNQSGAAF